MHRSPSVALCVAGFLSCLLLAAPALAEDAPINKSLLGGTAAKGYDVVAYFEDGEPVEGSSDYTHEWRGASWRFASAEHRDAFAAGPERYAPQYGGYCAYAVSKGTTADVDPQAWKIVDGKLYLNLSPRVQKLWEKDVPGHIAAADANWPDVAK